jgi:nuclear transcription factor Y gamma
MVQAAAQAQAVVAATKARGDLVPMSAAEINALSQKQAKAIVNARQQTTATTLTESEVKTQIQLQAQALVHAHTQAQIALNIYKGDATKTGATAVKPATTTISAATAKIAASSSSKEAAQPVAKKPRLAPLTLNPAQMIQQNNLTKAQSNQRAELQKNQRAQLASLRQQFQKENTANPPSEATIKRQAEQLQAMQEQQSKERNDQTQTFREEMQALQESFRQGNSSAAAVATTSAGSEPPTSSATPNLSHQIIVQPTAIPPPTSMQPAALPVVKPMATARVPATTTAAIAGHSIPGTFPLPTSVTQASAHISGIAAAAPKPPPPPEPVASSMSANLPSSEAAVSSSLIADQPDSVEFQSHLQSQLTTFWKGQLEEMQKLPIGTEHEFKNHNDLPLARIKRIMKSDEDVRMISAEAPVLFAKACEMFILELTLRSWNYSESNKRRTLQKEDLQAAIKKTDVFDFLVDVIN